MKIQKLIVFLTILVITSCELQTFSGPELNEEKMEYANYYFLLLEAEKIEMHPLDQEWEDDDLPILIINSKLVQITEDNQLTNVAVVDTLVSLLWDAVENKEEYNKIKIGFVESATERTADNAKYQWLVYPTNSLK